MIGCSPGTRSKPRLGQPLAEPGRVLGQPGAQLAGALEQVERTQRGGDDRRRDAVREEIGARALAQELDDLAPAGGVAAAGAAHRLPQRAGDDVHPLDHAEQLGRAAAALAHEADGVRVVDHHHRVVPLGQVADLAQAGDMPVHREDAVGGDQPPAGARRLDQARLQLVHVAVSVAQPSRLAEPDAVDDRGVVQLVGDDRVAVVQEHLEEAAVGIEAGRVEDRVVGAEERREPLLESAVDALRAADEAHRRHPVAPALERLGGRRLHLGVAGQPEVVVGAEVDQAPATVDLDVRALRRGEQPLLLVDAGRAQLVDLGGKRRAQVADHAACQSRITLPA